MAGEPILTDEEWALRAWLRAEFGSGTWVGFSPPRGDNPQFPQVIISGRIGGTPDPGFPIDRPRVSFRVWGGPGGAGRAAAVAARNKLVGLLNALALTPLDQSTVALWSTIENVSWMPDETDPDAPLASYVVDVQLGVRSP